MFFFPLEFFLGLWPRGVDLFASVVDFTSRFLAIKVDFEPLTHNLGLYEYILSP